MQQTSWGPKPAAVAALALAGILLAIACAVLATDAPGRILTGVAAAGLLVFAAGSWRARPRLAVTPGGLVYRGWLRTTTLSRPEITLVRITEFRRIGRKVRLLEIEAGERLIVLSRWDVGTDPIEVLDALTDAGYAGR